jgi:hypothetical protein
MSTNDFFQDLLEEIRAIPSRKSLKRQAVEAAFDDIEDAQARGVSMEELSRVFHKHGYDIAASSLRQHVREVRKDRAQAQNEATIHNSVPIKSSRKRASRQKSAGPGAANPDGNLQPAAGEMLIEDKSRNSTPEPDQQLPFGKRQSAF